METTIIDLYPTKTKYGDKIKLVVADGTSTKMIYLSVNRFMELLQVDFNKFKGMKLQIWQENVTLKDGKKVLVYRFGKVEGIKSPLSLKNDIIIALPSHQI